MYTNLSIINEMVVSTGAQPFKAEQKLHPLYLKADTLLQRVQTSYQTLGMWFNTEVRTVTAQSDGTITVPQNCIKADPTDRHCNLTLRGSKMYDLNEGQYFTGGDVRLKMVFRLPLEEIPVSGQEYIRAQAIFEFYLNEDGGDPKLSMYRNNRVEAWSVMYREHLNNVQANIRDNPHNTISRLRQGNSTRTLRIR